MDTALKCLEFDPVIVARLYLLSRHEKLLAMYTMADAAT